VELPDEGLREVDVFFLLGHGDARNGFAGEHAEAADHIIGRLAIGLVMAEAEAEERSILENSDVQGE